MPGPSQEPLMTFEVAKAFILREGYPNEDASKDALFVLFRMGEDPGPERTRRLLAALRVAF